MKKTDKKNDARVKTLYQLAQEAMDYRHQLVDQVEAIKVEMGAALANIEMREDPVCRVCGRDLRDEEFLLLARKTFFGDLPRVLQSSYLRTFFGDPEECLARAMKDITILREYLIPLIGNKCPAIPEPLAKIEIVEQVIIKK